MTHVKYQNTDYILSRERLGKLELVDPLTGDLVILDESQKGLLSEPRQVYLDTIPNLEHFPTRPASFLTELRTRRETFLKEYRLRERRGPKVEKSPTVKIKRASKSKKVSKNLSDALQNLPPELQELFRSQIK